MEKAKNLKPMLNIKNILVPYDFSPGSSQALSYALNLVDRNDANLHMVYAEVLHGQPFDSEKELPSDRKKIQTHLQKNAADLPEHRLVCEVVHGVAVAPALLDYAEENDIDIIVMGTHGRRGVQRMFIGSVAEEMVRLATCPVLTIRQQKTQPEAQPISSILAPVDFSEHSREALHYARVLANSYGAGTLHHVVEEILNPAFYGRGAHSGYELSPDIEDRAIKHLEHFYQNTQGPDVDVHFVALPGSAIPSIVHQAEDEGHDLIVMATHGRTGFEHFTMGSVAEKVVRRAPCPVFTVKSFGKSLLAD